MSFPSAGADQLQDPRVLSPPAEPEGHLLDHPDVGDVCGVGIELPFAFVSSGASAHRPAAAEEVRKAIMPELPICEGLNADLGCVPTSRSTSRTIK
ncbi:hypothetical protein GY45DRAFT_252223 [Cubamyces sp. BRFM 1775]|nr:hypothetical protein GY45DRAFT_252223 [Cubamyces sp. BRFM 1775]